MTGFLIIIIDNKIVINNDFDILLNENVMKLNLFLDNIQFME